MEEILKHAGWSHKRFVICWAVAGSLVPVVVYVANGLDEWTNLAVALFPSSLLLMTLVHTDIASSSHFPIVFLFAAIICIAINALIYSTVGALLWRLLGRS